MDPDKRDKKIDIKRAQYKGVIIRSPKSSSLVN